MSVSLFQFQDLITAINSLLKTENGLIKDGRYQRRIHETTDSGNTITYIGFSDRAIPESSAAWSIRRVTERSDGTTDIDYSEDVSWEDRLTVEYQ